MSSILEFILANIGLFLKNIINFITSPLMKIIKMYIPDFSTYFGEVNNFLTTYVFKGVQFYKMVFLNITNINHSVFDLFILSFVIIINFSVLLLTFKLVYNLWQIYTGNKKGDT